MSGNAPLPPIIIRRKGGGGHGGHHGGAWKVAYADFTTAMMSFFLLLWLLNVTTSDQRQGIADYFAPASISDSSSGAGGAMGGKTITTDGQQISNASPPAQEEDTVPTAGKGVDGEEDTPGKDSGEAQKPQTSSGDKSHGEKSSGTQENGEKLSGVAALAAEAAATAEAVKKEEEFFKQAEDVLRKAIEENAELRAFSDQILIDRTSEGLRIQIVDKDNYSMFSSGSSILFERPRDLIRLVGRVISRLPNRISVTGHTDSAPFALGSRRDNWSLSTERANTSRSELVTAGVAEDRVARVVGMADRDPLIPANPKDSKNRRISIVLLRQNVNVGEESSKQPAPTSQSLPAPAGQKK